MWISPFSRRRYGSEEKNSVGEYKFHKRYWNDVSDEVKNLITSMLTVNKDTRITAKDALKILWFHPNQRKQPPENDGVWSKATRKVVIRKVKAAVHVIIAANKLQRVVYDYRAYQDF